MAELLTIDLAELVEAQKKLRAEIVKKHGLEGKKLLYNLITAFKVEVAELANELRFFKHWSKKGPSDRETILEEYIDGLHFLLEIAIEKGYDDDIKAGPIPYGAIKDMTPNDYNRFFNRLFCCEFDTYFNFVVALNTFLSIGNALGFSNDDIKAGYFKKNAINYERQERGY